jgi:hypothetical protein
MQDLAGIWFHELYDILHVRKYETLPSLHVTSDAKMKSTRLERIQASHCCMGIPGHLFLHYPDTSPSPTLGLPLPQQCHPQLTNPTDAAPPPALNNPNPASLPQPQQPPHTHSTSQPPLPQL